MPKSQVHTNFVNVSHPRELNDAANITTIRRTAMLAIHRDKRCIRAKKALAVPQMEVAIALDNDMGGNSGQLLQNTIVIPELVEVQSVSLNWQDEDANQEILANGVGDSSSSFYSMLDMPTSVDDGICYTAHMCYPSQSYLLNHWTTVLGPLLLPVGTHHNPMISVWVNHAAGDPLLMCTILHHSAVHLDTVYQRPPTRLTHVYGMEAARLMNMRLASEDLNPKDTTIAAVIMMLANQIFACDLVDIQMYLDALERMVKMRGGIYTLGMDGVLQMTIILVDINTALLQNIRPRFLSFISSAASLSIDGCSQIETFPVLLFQLRQEIMDQTDKQSRLVDCPARTSTTEAIEFATRRTSIEHILLLASQWLATMRGQQDAHLREACCIAGSIYVNCVLRGLQFKLTLILTTLKNRLITCIETLELKDDGETGSVSTSIAALFWALSIGGAMSSDATDKSWFILHMTRAAKQLGLTSWGQVVELLKGFLWAEKLENEALKNIWADLQHSIPMN